MCKPSRPSGRPFGAAYLSGVWPTVTNAVTLAVMSVGVVRALAARRTVRCACLEAVFNLPMSTVTLADDAVMAVMTAAMRVGSHR